jgi:hypothetical protein
LKMNFMIEKALLFLRIIKFRLKSILVKHEREKLLKRVEPSAELRHKNLWKQLCWNPGLSWFRFYANFSGTTDYQYVPDDLYYAIIERRLSDVNYAKEVADKSNYDLMFDGKLFPANYLKNIAGSYLDSGNQIVTKKVAETIFQSIGDSIIIKPTIESGKGKNILLLTRKGDHFLDVGGHKFSLAMIEELYAKDFLIQEKIEQNKFIAAFNDTSLNTCRVLVYRSVVDDSIKILSAFLRIGKKGMSVDNVSAGGLAVGVDLNSGQLKEFAISFDTTRNFRSYYKHYRHPGSMLEFNGKTMPGFQDIKNAVETVALRIPSQRMLRVRAILTLPINA